MRAAEAPVVLPCELTRVLTPRLDRFGQGRIRVSRPTPGQATLAIEGTTVTVEPDCGKSLRIPFRRIRVVRIRPVSISTQIRLILFGGFFKAAFFALVKTGLGMLLLSGMLTLAGIDIPDHVELALAASLVLGFACSLPIEMTPDVLRIEERRSRLAFLAEDASGFVVTVRRGAQRQVVRRLCAGGLSVRIEPEPEGWLDRIWPVFRRVVDELKDLF